MRGVPRSGAGSARFQNLPVAQSTGKEARDRLRVLALGRHLRRVERHRPPRGFLAERCHQGETLPVGGIGQPRNLLSSQLQRRQLVPRAVGEPAAGHDLHRELVAAERGGDVEQIQDLAPGQPARRRDEQRADRELVQRPPPGRRRGRDGRRRAPSDDQPHRPLAPRADEPVRFLRGQDHRPDVLARLRAVDIEAGTKSREAPALADQVTSSPRSRGPTLVRHGPHERRLTIPRAKYSRPRPRIRDSTKRESEEARVIERDASNSWFR